jgi:hypothetical protein
VYNYLMKGGGWKPQRDRIDADRFYADQDYSEFALVDGQAPPALLALPALLMPEVNNRDDQTAQVAMISSARTSRGMLLIEYTTDPAIPPILVNKLIELADELDIPTGGISLSRTRWSLNNADLIGVLSKHKAIPKPKSASARARAGIRANSGQIVVMAEALARTIDEKIDQLKSQRPNSPEAQATISDYERLRSQVAALQNEIAKFQRGATTDVKAVSAAAKFESGVTGFLKKHPEIVSGTTKSGLIFSFVAMFHLLGVNPTLCFAVTSALIGGRDATAVIRGFFKSEKKD